MGDWDRFVTHSCAFTAASTAVPGVHSNEDQFGWLAPVWPAWNASKEDWSFYNLSIGITDPPLVGSSPYTGFETGMWGEDRIGIGSFYFGTEVPNIIPRIVGQNKVHYLLDRNGSFVLRIDDLRVLDSDNKFPDDFKMIVLAGSKYTYERVSDWEYIITTAKNHMAALWVNVKVNDGKDDSPVFRFKVLPMGKGCGIISKILLLIRYLMAHHCFVVWKKYR